MTTPERSFITVVSGLPRSGTSLMMQMLEAGGIPPLCDGRRPPDAHNPRGYYEFEPVKRLASDADWIDLARAKAVKVIHALLPYLPTDRPYRVVLMRRRLAEVIASQDAMLSGRSGGVGRLRRERLARIFEAQLAALGPWLARCSEAKLLEVEHGGLLANPGAVSRQLDRFLGGGLDGAAMARVVEPALYRRRDAEGGGGGARVS